MSFLFKALERLVKWHIEGHAKPFQPNQHAFCKGHCTENALSLMTDIIESSISLGHIALVVYLDIKGAFDNLSSTSIAKGMTAHDVDKDIIGYLNHRYCKVKGSKQFFKLVRGTGQGGILSPMVWNFVMDFFLEKFLDSPLEVIGYATTEL
jgi:retron-type reverse transcriptase